MVKNKSKNTDRGITLIALVITIIVLLILAGVAISVLAGDDGIIKKAVEAREKTEDAAVNEADTLNDMESVINDYTAKTITFTIDGQTHSAKEGMTWGQWCSSTEYNTVGASVEEITGNDWGLSTNDIYNVITKGDSYYLRLVIGTDDVSDDDLDVTSEVHFVLSTTKILDGFAYEWSGM